MPLPNKNGLIIKVGIPMTTRCFLEEWRRRNWSTEDLFTLFLEREDPTNITSSIKRIEVINGLRLEK